MKDIVARSATIQQVIKTGYMPLWKPDPSYSHFQNENYLPADEKEKLLQWLQGGTPPGNCNKNFEHGTISNIGKPDYVLQVNEPYELTKNEETFATIKIPFEFDSSFYVKSIEFVPHHSQLIHHVGIFILEQQENMPDLHAGPDRYTYPPADFTPAEDTFLNVYYDLSILPREQQFFWDMMVYKTHWQVGMSPRIFPEGMGFKMPRKGAILIDNIHYKASPEKVLDQITINIFKQDKPVERFCYSASLGNGELAAVEPPLQIPPEKIQTHHAKLKLPYDMALLDVTPHMHELGKNFISYAVTPENDTIPIVRINDWDPSWMETYRFNPMLKIPAGSTLYIYGTFDNTSKNPRNPSNPPRFVGQSMRKHDEMLDMIFSFFDYQEGDEHTILESQITRGK